MNALPPAQDVVITAPGKAFLIGEYAVLDGADAIVLAVARRVTLRRGHGPSQGLVARAVLAAAESLGRADLAALSFQADSSALSRRGQKIGLGSSAAVAAASVAAVFHEAGLEIAQPDVRWRLWEVARAAHDAFQEQQGSGGDVAASVFGGVIRLTRAPDGSPCIERWRLPRGVRLVFLWSGQPASTRRMVRAVRTVREGRRAEYSGLIAQMARVSRAFAQADQPDVAIEVLAEYANLLGELGRLCGVPIVTPFADVVGQVARRFGGAAKPSGAGGGDLVVAALPEDADLCAFREAVGIGADLDLSLDPEGVRVEAASAFVQEDHPC